MTPSLFSDHSTQAGIIAHQIKQIIQEGEVRPGDGLNEQKLADRFGVSRTPVREALRLLTAAGIVEQEPRKRARVARMSVGQVLETLEALAEIEACCTRLAVNRMTPVERASLAQIHNEFCRARKRKKANVVTLSKINIKFHEQLIVGSHNRVLIEMAQALSLKVLYYRAQQAHQVGRLEESEAEHAAILKAIDDNDPDAAYNLMRAHFDIVAGNISSLISMVEALD